jgi:predicted MFS family arabinose efflux permease
LLWCGLAGHRFALRSLPSVLLLALALGGGVLLWRQQRARAHPFLPLDILRRPGVGWICATVLGFAGAMFGLLFVLPLYLQLGRGASAAGAGVQLLPLTIGILVGSTLNSRYTARTGVVGQLPPWGMGAVALALALLALAPPNQVVTLVAATVCGLGLGTVMPNAQLAVQLIAGRSRLGAGAALLSLTRSFGASFGTAAFGGLAFVLLGQSLPAEGGTLQAGALDPEQATRAFRWVFGVLAVYAAVGAYFAWRMPRPHLSEEAVTSMVGAE